MAKDDQLRIEAALVQHSGVRSLVHLKTLYVGPDELMVATTLAFAGTATIEQVTTVIDEVEVMVRAAVPAARVIYLEPGLVDAPIRQPD